MTDRVQGRVDFTITWLGVSISLRSCRWSCSGGVLQSNARNHNKLARVLGTHQHSSVKATTKSIDAFSVGLESEEDGPVSKAQQKHKKKISA